MIKLNLVVIRTSNLEVLKNQYELLGLNFTYHKHGNGPYHYSATDGKFTFEIYPLTKSMREANHTLRLGFEVNLTEVLSNIKNTDWVLLSDIQETSWGQIAIIQDMDGRKIELKNK